MGTNRDIRTWAGGSADDQDRLLAHLEENPGDTHELISALTCGERRVEDGAAAVLLRLAEAQPAQVEPFVHRLFRIAGGSEQQAVRLAIAGAAPKLTLRSRQAGRLAFVFESWLDDRDPDIKRAAMTALVALVPQRPSLGPRIRSEIERRAEEGSPTAIKHGLKLLESLREF